MLGSAAVDTQTTMAQLHNVATACGVYKKVHGEWPRDLDKLGEIRAGQHITDISGKSRDVWGNPILYECPSFSSNSVGSVTSYGPDGAPGGDDDLVPPSGLLEQFPSDVIVEDGRVDIYDLELFVQTFSVKKLDNEVTQVLNLGQTGHEDQN